VRWAQSQRIAFIRGRLLRPGFINRAHLMKRFGISMPQASIDIREFLKLYPTAMEYNKAAKRYEARRTGTHKHEHARLPAELQTSIRAAY
jgi:hypothetical protein